MEVFRFETDHHTAPVGSELWLRALTRKFSCIFIYTLAGHARLLHTCWFLFCCCSYILDLFLWHQTTSTPCSCVVCYLLFRTRFFCVYTGSQSSAGRQCCFDVFLRHKLLYLTSASFLSCQFFLKFYIYLMMILNFGYKVWNIACDHKSPTSCVCWMLRWSVRLFVDLLVYCLFITFTPFVGIWLAMSRTDEVWIK